MKRHNREGFTLIELLVVIAIIALLMAIIMPALHAAKEIAGAAVCLSNQGQLGKAYYMYAGENDGFLMDGQPAAPADKGHRTYNGKKAHNFVGEPMQLNGTVFYNTSLEDQIRGFEVGALWAYMEAPGAYNCPTDKRWRNPPPNPSPTANNEIGGYRSYSIGAVLSAGGYNETGTGENKAVILKYSEFSNPGSKVVFLEEQAGDGHNENYWNMYLTSPQWWDPFAVAHNGSSTFSYADGHADRYKWTDKNMIKMSAEGLKALPADDTSDDYNWFRRAYIPGRLRP